MKVNFMESITPKQVIIKFLGDLQGRKKTQLDKHESIGIKKIRCKCLASIQKNYD